MGQGLWPAVFASNTSFLRKIFLSMELSHCALHSISLLRLDLAQLHGFLNECTDFLVGVFNRITGQVGIAMRDLTAHRSLQKFARTLAANA